MTKLEAQSKQFERALLRLDEALAEPKTDIVRDSAIQRFEFTLDLGWKTLKTFLEDKKGIVCASPKECFREAYRQSVVGYENEWLKLVDMRNETVHTYNEETAEKIYLELKGAMKYFRELLEIIQKNT
jgi:nucleotidyltransferase substrate binding protein (TIGR01987 family)